MSIHQGLFVRPPVVAAVILVAVGLSAIQTSPDAVTWTSRTAPDTMQYNSVCYSSALGLWVACGNSNTPGAGASFATSPDGITWTRRTGPQAANWSSVCWSDSLALFVAVCKDSASKTFAVATSTDGITWTGRTGLTSTWAGVCWYAHQNIFVAVGAGGANKIMTSPDGTNWTARTDPAGQAWSCVAATPTTVVTVLSSSQGGFALSANGTTFTSRACQLQSTQAACFFTPIGAILAVGAGFASPSTKFDQQGDTTWSDGSLTVSSNWSGVCYSATLGLAVACSASSTNRIATTSNGSSWTIRTDAANGGWAAIAAKS